MNDRPTRICLVSAELAPFSGGGAGVYAAHMARALAGAGAEVHLLTTPHQKLDSRAERLFPGVRIHTHDPSEGEFAFPAYHCPPMRRAMSVYQALKPLHDEHRFDIIETPDIRAEGYFLFRARRAMGLFEDCVLSVRIHTPGAVLYDRHGRSWYNRSDAVVEHMERTVLAEADILLSPSAAAIAEIERVLPGVRREGRPEAVTPNPFPSRPAPPRADGPTMLLCVGRIERLKGQHLLVQAAVELLDKGHDLSVLLAGADSVTGPLRTSMRETIAKQIPGRWRDRFVFLGPVDPPTVRRLLSRATALVAPSLWDNLPYSVLEAMGAATPVIASDAGGIPEMIADREHGLLFANGDASALRDAIETLIEDTELQSALSAAGPARARELADPQAAAAGALDAYAPLLKPAEPRRRAPTVTPRRLCVVIPYFNMGELTDQTLASLARQTRQPDEVVLVNDGSTDPASLDWLDRTARRNTHHLPLRVLHTDNAGVAAARNTGVARTDAPLVFPLDADDLLAPDAIEKLEAALERNPDASYATPLIASFRKDPLKPVTGWVPLGLHRDLLTCFNVGGASAALFRREAIEEVGGWDPTMPGYEDWELWCRMALLGMQGVVVPEFLLRYRLRPGSRLHNDSTKHADLIAELASRHPALAERPDRAFRLALSLSEQARRKAGQPGPAPSARKASG
ncbi:MAG: glycosyltransferase [Phycisphaerales bacterium]|nr:glycosyltransferase [Phycisphaerales bacterium]